MEASNSSVLLYSPSQSEHTPNIHANIPLHGVVGFNSSSFGVSPTNSPLESFSPFASRRTVLGKRERLNDFVDESSELKRLKEAIVKTGKSICIAEGFSTPPLEKVPGGKDNRKPLPRHIIAVDLTALPTPYEFTSAASHVGSLIVRASLMGYKRLSSAREEVHLTTLETIPLIKAAKLAMNLYHLHFENLVVNYSSHNHGQKLFIRFSLVDATKPSEDPEICFVDSSVFETITKRGIESK
jgi:hypothetical protein